MKASTSIDVYFEVSPEDGIADIDVSSLNRHGAVKMRPSALKVTSSSASHVRVQVHGTVIDSHGQLGYRDFVNVPTKLIPLSTRRKLVAAAPILKGILNLRTLDA